MDFRAESSPSETQPLLQPPLGEPINAPQELTSPVNKYSTADICWILTGIWSGVFLGAVDGWFYLFYWALNCTWNRRVFLRQRHHCSDSFGTYWRFFQQVQSILIHWYIILVVGLLLHSAIRYVRDRTLQSRSLTLQCLRSFVRYPRPERRPACCSHSIR